MRRIAAVLLLLAACGTAVPIAEPPTVEDAAQSSQFSIVSGDRAYCGAVQISPWLAVTARHCLRGSDVVRYAYSDAGWFTFGQAWAVAQDSDRDLALLSLDVPRRTWLPLQLLNPLQDGDPVRNRNGWTRVRHADRWVRTKSGTVILSIETEAPAYPGMSGSGLVDRFGALVGVCRGFDLHTERGDYAPITTVVELWSEAQTNE